MRLSSFFAVLWIVCLACRAPLAAEDRLVRGVEGVDNSELVHVDVVVTNRHGKAIRGLGADDFQIFEDDQPVAVSRFSSRHDGLLDDTPLDAASLDSQPRGDEARADSSLRLVFLIDLVHLPADQKSTVLSQLVEFVHKSFRPGDEAMVVRHDGAISIEQRFTKNLALVTAAIENLASPSKLRVGSLAFERNSILQRIADAQVLDDASGPQLRQQALEQTGSFEETPSFDQVVSEAETILEEVDQYAQSSASDSFRTLAELQSFFGTLAGVPGRKAVVYVSDGLPPRPGEALYRAWRAKFSMLSDASFDDAPLCRKANRLFARAGSKAMQGAEHTVDESESFNAAWAFRQLGRMASNSRITVYRLRPGDPKNVEPRGSRHALLWGDLAVTTGGFASPGLVSDGLIQTETASFGDDLDRLGQDFGTFYSLAFLPRPSKERAGERRIEVIRRRQDDPTGFDDEDLRHRASYGTRSRQQIMDDRTLASLVHETTKNPLGVTIDLSTVLLDEHGQQRMPILVKIPVDNLVLLPVEDHYEGRVSIHVGARDTAGQTSPIESVRVDIHVPSHHLEDSEGQTRIFGHQLMIKMSPGEHLLAVGVLDEVGNTQATTLVESLDGRSALASDPHP